MIAGLIVSAGKSARMGEFKPLLNYKGETFIHQIIARLDTVCRYIIIVTGFDSERLRNETINALMDRGQELILNKIKFAENIEYEKGMFSSLQRGLKELLDSNLNTAGADWLIYHFVDQPGLPNDFYSGFIEQIDNNYNWIQPSYKNRMGHPILLGNDLFNTILQADSKANLREISRLSLIKKKIWECSYKNILQDLDTWEDYMSRLDQ